MKRVATDVDGVLDHENRSGGQLEWFLVGLASQKKYISMYVNAVKDGAYMLRDYETRLGKAKVGSARISFVSGRRHRSGVLMELIEEASSGQPE